MVYDPAKFARGVEVKVVDRDALEEFAREWRNKHYPLQPEQLAYAGRTATVDKSMMYHGGYILYQLLDVPGIWHECCLRSA
jgi:hypothetical protein